MVVSGKKTEEYRDATEYWQKRLLKYKIDIALNDTVTVTFSNGYRKDRRQVEIELQRIEFGIGNAEWGASGEKQHILYLGNIITKKF